MSKYCAHLVRRWAKQSIQCAHGTPRDHLLTPTVAYKPQRNVHSNIFFRKIQYFWKIMSYWALKSKIVSSRLQKMPFFQHAFTLTCLYLLLDLPKKSIHSSRRAFQTNYFKVIRILGNDDRFLVNILTPARYLPKKGPKTTYVLNRLPVKILCVSDTPCYRGGIRVSRG